MDKNMVIFSVIALLAISLVSAQAPVASYGFDEGSGTVAGDSSGNGNDGTITGTTWDTGYFGGALSFDVGDEVTIVDDDSLDLTDDFTISAWINPSSLGPAWTWRTLVWKGGQASPFNYYFDIVGAELAFALNWQEVRSGEVLTVDTWSHVAAVHDDSADSLAFYVDGVLVVSNIIAGSPQTNTADLVIGSSPSGEYFRGLIDELRIYDRTLTETEIATDMNNPVASNSTLPADTTPPVRSNGWPTGSLLAGTVQTTLSLDTNEDSTCRYSTTPDVAYDSMANTFTTNGGTLHSTTVSGLADGNSYAYYVKCTDLLNNTNPDDFVISFSVNNPGQGYSLQFFGNSLNILERLTDRVRIVVDDPALSNDTSPPIDIGAEDFTMEFWMRANAADNNATADICGQFGTWIRGNMIIDRDRNGEPRDFGVSIGDGGIMFGLSTETSNGAFSICGPTNVLDNQWHHIAVQRRISDGYMWLYVDGVLDAEADGPDGDISYPDNASVNQGSQDPFLVLGAEKHDANPLLFPPYAGLFDEFRVSNVLRYNSTFGPQTTPFVADSNTVGLYHFNTGTGTTAFDVSGAVGGPSDGELLIGGDSIGPQWVNDTPISGNGTNLTFCGDISCNGNEDCSTCEEDCGVCPDTTAPVMTSGSNEIFMSLTTDEDSTCRYDTVADTDYASMPFGFATTGTTTHTTNVTVLASGNYNFYINCEDSEGNSNTVDLLKSFIVG